MKKIGTLLTALVMVAGLSAQAYASLIVRGTDTAGKKLIYDTDRNITWYDFTFDAPWPAAMDWASNLVVDFDGTHLSGWRLPTAVNADGSGPCSGPNCSGSEMGHLFYTELGNPAYPPGAIPSAIFTDGLTGNTDTFQQLYAYQYWTGTQGTPVGSHVLQAWGFSTKLGVQTQYIAFYDGAPYGHAYAMAVRDGDVSAVPVPGAVWLFGSGLVGLIGVRRKKKA